MVEHLPLVRIVARGIHQRLPQFVPIEDLQSAGVSGLLDALAKFDSSREVQFRTYARHRIRGAILDSLRTNDWGPRRLRREGRAVQRAVQTLTGQFKRSPIDIEIAKELGIPLTAYHQLVRELSELELGSLHFKHSEQEELDFIPARREDDPLFRYLDGEVRERITKAINDLPERECLIMTLYYYEETTMKEIGLILGIAESRVSQMHASAVSRLRARLSALATGRRP
jgi:RNA polymerase sigma factor FliA